jgi:hypothetical protein
MNSHRGLLVLLALVGVILSTTGLFQWQRDGSLTLHSRIYLGAGLAVVCALMIEQTRRSLHVSGKTRFPHDDELSLQLKHRAAFIAFHLSIFLWMGIFLIQDVFPESQVMLGVGILGMVALYGLSYLAIKSQVLRDADQN